MNINKAIFDDLYRLTGVTLTQADVPQIPQEVANALLEILELNPTIHFRLLRLDTNVSGYTLKAGNKIVRTITDTIATELSYLMPREYFTCPAKRSLYISLCASR